MKIPNVPRTLVGIAVLSALLVALGLLGSRGGATSRGDTSPPSMSVNQIAYVDLDGLLHLADFDTGETLQISPDVGLFTWPTWSPDAQRLVFSGVTRDGASGIRISLFSYNTTLDERREFYVGNPGVLGLLADGVAHYPQWSPDGKKLAFVTFTSRGMTLLIDDLDDNADPEFVMDDGPVWSTWSPDSQYLLVHRGLDLFLVNTLEGPEISRLETGFARYRVPAWKPRGGAVTVVVEDDSGALRLSTAEVQSDGLGEFQAIADVTENPAYLWSPDGEYLAVGSSGDVIVYQSSILYRFQRLTLLPENGSRESIEIADDVLAYFWSPDGTKLAYATLSDQRGAMRWMLLDTKDGNRWPLVDFVPSRDQLTMFEFFDQYAYSHSLWSPDSKFLVFAGRIEEGGVSASLVSHPGHEGSHIIVVDTQANGIADQIAAGGLGVWSPR